MRKNSLLVVLCLLATDISAMAEDLNVSAKEAFQADIRNKIGGGERSVAEFNKAGGGGKRGLDDFFDVVVYTDIYEQYTNNVPYQQTSSVSTGIIGMATPAKDYMSELSAVMGREHNISLANAARKKSIPAYFVGGYCSVMTPAKISKSSEFTKLSCMLDFGDSNYRRAEVFTGVYPDHEREILVGLPVYASFENGKKASMNGVVMRRNKGSFNIADSVDNKRIRKLLAESALATNDIAYKYATAYMAAVTYSNVQTKVRYHQSRDANGNVVSTPITTSKVKPPALEDYFFAAGVELFSGIAGVIGKDYLYDLSPLYELNKGKVVYVEGVVTFDNTGLAKKFGVLSAEERQNALAGSDRYKQKNISRANQYGNKGEDNMLRILQQQSQNQQQQGRYGYVPPSQNRNVPSLPN